MKTINILTYLLIIAIICCPLYAQTPEYFCSLTNDEQTGLNTYEFDIYLVRLGTTLLELSGFQGGVTFNTAILNGGTVSWTIVPGSSQLISYQIPQSFLVDNSLGVLKLPSRMPPGPGNGTIISNTLPGTKIGRFRITLNGAVGGTFGPHPINIQWCFDIAYYRTAVAAYVSGINTDITQQAYHFNDLSNPTLPIQLLSFKAIPNPKGAGVKLEWSTISEINNFGFYVQKYDKIIQDFLTIEGSFLSGYNYSLEPHYYSWLDEDITGENMVYRLKQVDNDGLVHYYGPISYNTLSAGLDKNLPSDYYLFQNYPNPFNPETKIKFGIPEESLVKIQVFNIIGHCVKTLTDKNYSVGFHEIEFNTDNIAGGQYFYRLHAISSNGKQFINIKKFIILK